MKISKALKKISKIKGEISELRSRIDEANVALEDNEFQEDAVALLEEYRNKQAILIDLKKSVMEANIKSGKYEAILLLAEKKSEVVLLKSLDIKEGKHEGEGFGDNTLYNYRSRITRTMRNDAVKHLEDEIEDLRDELDEFNATHVI